MKALLLIDIQYDFLPGGSLAVSEGNLIIPVVNTIQPYFDLVVATQDWHPTNHKSFASNHEGKNVFEKIELAGMEQVLWPDHCVQETKGADLTNELYTHNVEAIFRKGTEAEIDSYSAFYDNGHMKSTGLAHYLRGKEIRQVYVAGLAGDYCVYFSATDALKEGFETFIIEDATRSISQDGFEKAKNDIVLKGGKIINSSHLI